MYNELLLIFLRKKSQQPDRKTKKIYKQSQKKRKWPLNIWGNAHLIQTKRNAK